MLSYLYFILSFLIINMIDVNQLRRPTKDDFEILCYKELALQKDFLTMSDCSDIFSETSEYPSHFNSADLKDIQPNFLLQEGMKNKDVWDIGFNIGSNFLSNSFLYTGESKSKGAINCLPQPKECDKYALVPSNHFEKHNGTFLPKQGHWKYKKDDRFCVEDYTKRFTSEYLKSKYYEKPNGTRPDIDSDEVKVRELVNSEDEEDEEEEKVPLQKVLPQKRRHAKLTKRRKRKNLCIREDVMNKNVLRALKRELITLYENYDTSTVKGGFREKVKEF